jgi:hypothetical protein
LGTFARKPPFSSVPRRGAALKRGVIRSSNRRTWCIMLRLPERTSTHRANTSSMLRPVSPGRACVRCAWPLPPRRLRRHEIDKVYPAVHAQVHTSRRATGWRHGFRDRLHSARARGPRHTATTAGCADATTAAQCRQDRGRPLATLVAAVGKRQDRLAHNARGARDGALRLERAQPGQGGPFSTRRWATCRP